MSEPNDYAAVLSLLADQFDRGELALTEPARQGKVVAILRNVAAAHQEQSDEIARLKAELEQRKRQECQSLFGLGINL